MEGVLKKKILMTLNLYIIQMIHPLPCLGKQFEQLNLLTGYKDMNDLVRLYTILLLMRMEIWLQ